MTIFSQRMIFSRMNIYGYLCVWLFILFKICGSSWAGGAENNKKAVCSDGIMYSQKINTYDDVVHGDSTIYFLQLLNVDCEYHIDELSFYSIHRGKKILLKREILEYEFIGVTILGDGANIYVTQITPTGAYNVFGYFLEPNKVEKILSVGSYFPPNFLLLENYHEALFIDRNDKMEKRIPDIYDVYEVVGKKVIHHKDVKFALPRKFKE